MHFCWTNVVLFWFWAIFDLKFGLLAKSYVGYTSPDPPKKRLGVDFPEVLFFSRTPVLLENYQKNLENPEF